MEDERDPLVEDAFNEALNTLETGLRRDYYLSERKWEEIVWWDQAIGDKMDRVTDSLTELLEGLRARIVELGVTPRKRKARR
jgi:hypothetical protein